MVDRFEAWERTPVGETPAPETRRGVLFGLASTIVTPARKAPPPSSTRSPPGSRNTAPSPKTASSSDLSFVPTVFDRLEPSLVAALVYRGWWLTGAALAQHQPGFADLPPDVTPPSS